MAEVEILNANEYPEATLGDPFSIMNDKKRRFEAPEGIVRVTSGFGGESFLIFGSEKTALHDCGMAYSANRLLANINKALAEAEPKYGRRTLDYVLLSHTHYDHCGALPYVRRAFPGVEVFGAEHAAYVFSRPGALKLMKELGTKARDKLSVNRDEILTDGMTIDTILKDGDRVSLGKEWVEAYETPGHTACSLTFMIQPAGVMFASESTGVYTSRYWIECDLAKSYLESIASSEKCRALAPKKIISPHYGVVPDNVTDIYFDVFEGSADFVKKFVLNRAFSGMKESEIMRQYGELQWSEFRSLSQPKDAFLLNAKNMIHVILKEFNAPGIEE